MLKPFETHLIQIGSFLPIFAGLKLPPTVACGSEVSWEAEIGEPNSLNLRRFGLPSCTAKSNAWGCTFVVPLESGITWCTTLTTRRGRKILSLSCVCFIHSDVVWFTSEKQKCLTWCICIYIYKYIYTYKYCIQLDGKSPRPTEKLQINYCRKPKISEVSLHRSRNSPQTLK